MAKIEKKVKDEVKAIDKCFPETRAEIYRLWWEKNMPPKVLSRDEITKIVNGARNIITQETATIADKVVRLCDLLSKPENHITIRAEPHKPVRTIQDMVNEMARDLSNLPRFTAYAKVLQQKGKMGEIQLTVKEKITTLKLSKRQHVLGYIAANQNARESGKKYCKDRAEIEKEIMERQESWKGRSQAAEVPAPSKKPDRKRIPDKPPPTNY